MGSGLLASELLRVRIPPWALPEGLERSRPFAFVGLGAWIQRMRLLSGKVVGGKVEVEGEPLKEGSIVTVLALEDEEPFELSPEQEAELARGIQEVERGQFVDGDEFLKELSRE